MGCYYRRSFSYMEWWYTLYLPAVDILQFLGALVWLSSTVLNLTAPSIWKASVYFTNPWLLSPSSTFLSFEFGTSEQLLADDVTLTP